MSGTILVVDDCATTRKIVSLYLKKGGFDIILAEDGIDALEKLAVNSVSLVITDLNMPQMDGIEFISAMRENNSSMNIPVILLTTERTEDEKLRGLKAGANIFLSKPVAKETLLKEVGKLLIHR